MCKGDDTSCPEFAKHAAEFREELDHERRSFLKSSRAVRIANRASAATMAGAAMAIATR